MRGAKGPGGQDAILEVLGEPGHRVDFSGFQRFVQRQLRQNSGHTASQHGFPASGRADHQQVVPAGSSYFQSSLHLILTFHVVHIQGKIVEYGKDLVEIHFCGFNGGFPSQIAYCFGERGYGDHLDAIDDGGFFSILVGHDEGVHAVPFG